MIASPLISSCTNSLVPDVACSTYILVLRCCKNDVLCWRDCLHLAAHGISNLANIRCLAGGHQIIVSAARQWMSYQLTVSTTFHPNALHAAANNASPDIILLSSDGISFYVHRAVLMHASSNGFGGLLARLSYPGIPVSAEDDTETLDVVLGAVYGIAALPVLRWPVLSRIVSTLHARYGVPFPVPGSPLFGALAAHVFRPGGAQDVYAFAGRHDCEALAVAASEHLLSMSLTDASTEWAAAVGATYMRRLYFLQLGRVDALKRILPLRPALHTPETACGMREMQKHTLQPWARGVAELIFDARADMQPAAISAKLNPIAYRTPCAKCAAAVRQRVEAMVQEWSAIKKTI